MNKATVKRWINWIVPLFSKLPGGGYIYRMIIEAGMNRKMEANYHTLRMTFMAPNALTDYRVSTFSTKEPETLEWIDSIPLGAVVWDVGANIGLYAIYAAKKRNCQVYAFEPSVFNLELLARNIFANNLQNKITIVPVALSDKMGASLFKMSSTAWGGALSTFDADFDQNGAKLNCIFEYQTMGVSMADAVASLGIPRPQFIKIDVDGIEHFILRGGRSVLEGVQSVLIEINDDFSAQADESAMHLKNAGLSLYRKCDLGVPNQYNQWWVRQNIEPCTN